MKILYVTERFPWPLEDGGNLRSYHLLKELAAEFSVTLVSHRPGADVESAEAHLRTFCDVETVARPSIAKKLLRLGRRPGQWKWPVFIMKNWSDELLRTARRIHANDPHDIVHWNHLDTAAYCRHGDWPKMVFDSHNCLSLMTRQVVERGVSGVQGLALRSESKRLAENEAMICRHMNLVLACSNLDGNAFSALHPAGRVAVVPNGVSLCQDVNKIVPKQCASTEMLCTDPRTIVFVGAMNYLPNEIGVDWFVKQVLPRISLQEQPIRFQIVGRDPTPKVKALETNSLRQMSNIKVEVTGRVVDVLEYVRSADVVVVPLLHGGGTRLKILEAFGCGKAVVSTTKGAEGIDAIDGKHLLLCNDPEDFAREVSRLLSSTTQRSKLGLEAERLAKENYDWSIIGSRLRDLYRPLAGIDSKK